MLLSEFINVKEKPGCNITEEGRACAVHGLNECPGYKMIETSTREKLHQRHQEIRKKSGLPNPDYYKELKATFDLPDEERHVAVAALKKKYNVNESLRPGEYHHYETDPETGKRVYKGIRGERYGSPGGDRRGDEQERRDREARAHRHHDRKMTEREVDEDSIDDSLGAQYSTPQAKAKTQAIDQAFTSGQQSDFDRLGIISPQQIERDYKTMRAGEKAQDAAVYANPALTPGARSAPTFKTNPKGVPIREREVDEAGPFSYGAKKPRKGSVADLAAKKRKEQEKDKQPAEPRDYMVGVARVVKDVAEGSNPAGVVVKISGREYAAMSPEQKAAKQREWQQLKQQAKKRLQTFTIVDTDKEQGVAEGVEQYLEELSRAGYEVITETVQLCPECGGPAFADYLLAEKQDACYHKVKSRYKVWPSAYASGALVRCRKKGAKNWGSKSKK